MRGWIGARLTRQLALMTLLAFIIGCGAYLGLDAAADTLICNYYESRPDLVGKQAQALLDKFQQTVTDKAIAATDSAAISAWVQKYPLLILQIYQQNALVYDSTRSKSSQLHMHQAQHTPSMHQAVRTITFANGAASVSLAVFPETSTMQWVRMAILLFSAAVAFAIILLGVSRKTRHVARLEQEVLAIAGGEWALPLTVSGADEMARLAECIDQLRGALVSKVRREEAQRLEADQWVTALAHDLRTPLTSLIGYLTLLSRGELSKSQQALAEKALQKAFRTKEMSDILFQCFASLPQEETQAAPMSAQAFAQVLEERLCELREKGFSVEGVIAPPTALPLAEPAALARVLDNVCSNLDKHATRAEAIRVTAAEEGYVFSVAFESTTKPDADMQGTGLGLAICGNLMRGMGGSFAWEGSGKGFRVTVAWKTVAEKA